MTYNTNDMILILWL